MFALSDIAFFLDVIGLHGYACPARNDTTFVGVHSGSNEGA